MNRQQVRISGFTKDMRKCVYKIDKCADTVITTIQHHYASEGAGYTSNEHDIRVTVFHKDELVYAYSLRGLPTIKQFKQIALREYRQWLQKNSAV